MQGSSREWRCDEEGDGRRVPAEREAPFPGGCEGDEFPQPEEKLLRGLQAAGCGVRFS